MKNEVGDKSPNEAALSVLIEGGTPALVPLRSICRGGYHPPERRTKKEKRRMEEWWAGTPARPNKFRKRKRFASKPFKFATFVSPLPKKFAAQYFSGTPVLIHKAQGISRGEHCLQESKNTATCRGGSPCPPKKDKTGAILTSHYIIKIYLLLTAGCRLPTAVNKKTLRLEGFYLFTLLRCFRGFLINFSLFFCRFSCSL